VRLHRALWSLALTAAIVGSSAAANDAARAAEPDNDDFASIELTNDDWTWEVVIYDGSGGSRRTPIDRPVIGRPALSPDGTQLVFTSWLTNETDGRWGLYLVDVDGSDLRLFTSSSGIDRDPAWSPDGRSIAFSRDTVGSTIRSNCCHIRVKAVGGGAAVRVPGTTGGTNPTWSPNGNRIAYEHPEGVKVTNLSGTNSYVLTGAGGLNPAWSPDGDEIAYVRPNLGAWEIAVRPANGGSDSLRVRSAARRIEDPQWDPDGSTVYYLRYGGEGYDGRFATAVWMQRRNDDPVRLFRTDRSIVHLSHRAAPETARCDFDGNGRSDLPIGVPGESFGPNGETGAVAVLYGKPAGIRATNDQLWSQSLGSIKGAAADGNHFGSAIACGDFDADGDVDLAVGIPGDDADSGAVTIIQGSPSRLSGSGDQRWNPDAGDLQGQSTPGHRFGETLATGDIDRDGYIDLAVGLPGARNTAGVVAVLYGGPGGISGDGDQRWHADKNGVPGEATPGHEFGSALAMGDFDGDGYTDLAVGVPGALGTAGTVVVLYGTANGIRSNGAQRWHQDVAGIGGVGTDGHRFGSALAVGDFDRDGHDDLAVGIPGDKQKAGAVTVLYGTSAGLDAAGDDRWHQDVTGIGGNATRNHGYGSALATADFDGDGYDDLAVGIPGAKNTAGAVNVLYGATGGLSTAGDQFLHQNVAGFLGTSYRGNAYGAALSGGDFDGDGYDDLAVGTPGDKKTAGTVAVIYGTGRGLTANGDQRWHQDKNNVEDSGEDGDAFGGAL
jgi:hypothetical protein